MGFAAVWAYFGFRAKSVAIGELQFPVLVIPQDESNVFIASDAPSLTQARIGAAETPQNGTTVIDARFNIYSEQNVKCDQGSGGMLFRAFVRPGAPLTFQFNLRPHRENGLQPALAQVLRSANLGVNPVAVDRWRKELASQTTMDGIIAVLKNSNAEALGIQPNEDNPTTEPSKSD